MEMESFMDDALRGGPDALAIACADVSAGFVIGTSARGETEREAATNAAACAAELCSMPRLDHEESDTAASGALVVGSHFIHAFARVTKRPELVVVGVARGDANVALLLEWVKRVAGRLGGDEVELAL